MGKTPIRAIAFTSLLALTACMGTAPGGGGAVASTGQPGQVQAISAAEKAQGAKLHPDLLAEYGGLYQAPQNAYVVNVGKNIAVQSGLGNARDDFTVSLLNSPVNNAFAIPGGYVYVTRQLLALMNDEAELAGVLGHEVGHVAARHSEKRQRAAQQNSLLGALGQLGLGLLLGDSGLGQLGQQIFGTGSQLLTLKYSREQEYEADDLGVIYLRNAGYDPRALSTMLTSLALQSAIDARVSGNASGSVPTWASTHPDPAKRVSRAASAAGTTTGVRNRDAFLTAINGVLYGDDPAQGVVNGQEFIHPVFRLSFRAPQGYTMQNGTSAVSISGQSAKASFTTAVYNGDLGGYVGRQFAALSQGGAAMTPSGVQRTTVNGLPAAYATARVNNGSQVIDVTVFAYEFSSSQAYHFVGLTASGQSGNLNSLYQSVKRISSAEAAAVKPRKISVVTVRAGDTIAGLAGRMAYDDLKVERFLALNALAANATLTAGQKVKVVVY